MEASAPKNGKILKALVPVLSVILILAIAATVWFFRTNTDEDVTDHEQDTPGVDVDGTLYEPDTTEFVVTNPEFRDFDRLNGLTELKHLDLTVLDLTPAGFEQIAATLTGNPEILWNVPFGAARLPSDITHLDITPDIPADAFGLISYFPRLESVQMDYPLGEPMITMAETLRERPDIRFTCHTQVYGLDIDSSTGTLTLNDMPIEELDSLRLALRALPDITRVEMKECGISNEEMGALRDEFPDTEFVWNIHIYGYTVPTDALSYSTLVGGGEYGWVDQEFNDIFRYCTDLVALDLGHHSITDISEIVNLKKLKYLILYENKITDISPLGELPELNFIELGENMVTDLTPLSRLEHLEDLNLNINFHLENIRSLAECTSMKRLYLGNCGLSAADAVYLQENLPEDCYFTYTAPRGVNNSWRDSEKSDAIRKAFTNWQYVTGYDSWEEITYQEGVELKTPPRRTIAADKNHQINKKGVLHK